MTFVVHRSEDAGAALSASNAFLVADPARHNAILTLLHDRALHGGAGRYWWVTDRDAVCGVVTQSPLNFRATLTTIPPEALALLVEAIAADAPDLPGVVGDAASAARFAGCWTEQRGVGAEPAEGQRIYQLGELRPPADVTGELWCATDDDLELVMAWFRGFEADTGMGSPDDLAEVVPTRIANEEIWLWHRDGADVSMARIADAAARTVRVGYVYTPPEHRGNGYAAAVVAAISALVLADRADRCVLYTQLSNPTSNAVYRRIGYEAIAEILAYRFLAQPR
jgi:predicted GNAT family acetyltransferase